MPVPIRRKQSTRAMKALDGEEGRVGGYLIVFGDAAQKDLQGEYFQKDTDFRWENYTEYPAFYHHGLNDKVKSLKIGMINVVTEADEIGIWVEGQLDLSDQYRRAINELVKRGDLYWSSAAIPHHVEVEPDGKIKTWPIYEGSLTPTPAEPRNTGISSIKSAVLEYQGLKSLAPEGLDEHFEKEGMTWVDADEDLPESAKKDAAVEDQPADPTPEETPSADPPSDAADKLPEEQPAPEENPSAGEGGEQEVPPTESATSQSEEAPAKEDTPEPEEEEEQAPNSSTSSDEEDDNAQKDSTASEAGNPTDSSDQPTETQKGIFNMDEYVKMLLSTVADGLQVSLTEDSRKSVEQKLYADTQKDVDSVYGEGTALEIPHIKFKLRDEAYRKTLAGYIREAATPDKADEAGEADEAKALADEIIGAASGEGGQLNHGQVDDPAAQNGFSGVAPYVPDMAEKSMWDQLSWADMSYLFDTRRKAAAKRPTEVQFYIPRFFNAMIHDKAKDEIDGYIKYLGHETDTHELGATPVAIKAFANIGGAIHRGVKADELEHTSNTGFGPEWIATLWQAELWRLLLNQTFIASQFRAFDMPSDPYIIPLEGDTPTVYSASETEDDSEYTYLGQLSSSRIPTDNMSISAKKMGINTRLSKEITEDSIISMLPYIRERQMLAAQQSMDRVLMNADSTAGSANINTTGSTPASKSDFLLGIKGLAKIAYDNSAWVDAGGANPGLLKYRELHDRLDPEFLNMSDDQFMVTTPRSFTRLKSMDKFLEAEIQSGRVTGRFGDIDGIPVISSHYYGDATADGKKSATDSLNTTGRAMIVYRPQFLLAYRRRIETWMQYNPQNDAYMMGMWVRFTFEKRADDRDAVVMLHNLNVGAAA
jgi:hypothetical protein